MRKRERTYSGTKDNAVTERELRNRQTARMAAAEGMVLLKNDGILPMKKCQKAALFGGAAVATVKGGTGSGDVNEREVVSIYQGFADAGIELTNREWLDSFQNIYRQARADWRNDILNKLQENKERKLLDIYSANVFHMPSGMPIKEDDLVEVDIAFYVIGRTAGEAADRFNKPGDYYLTEREKEELAYISAHCQNLAVIVNAGGLIDLQDILALENLKALISIVQPGMEGGHALADGGILENRCRLAVRVLEAVRASVGQGFPIEFRMSGSELFEGGYDLDEGVRIAQMIEPYVDIIHVSAGTYQRGFGDTHPSMFREHGCNVYLAAEIKKHVSVPVATIGGLNSPEQMEEIIASGKADIVYMARALLADPFLPRKVMAGKEEEIVKCLRCFTCMAERAVTSTRRCTVNPLIGREMEGIDIAPAAEKKKVLVAGGGPGGLYAAYTAARRGHRVILCEKEKELGGILKSEQALPFKQEMYQLAHTYALLAEKAGVEIHLNTEVTAEYAEEEHPDALIIAAGSRPFVPPIPGLDGENVVIVNNYYLEKDKVTDDVVVFGGGLAGCECAIHLGMEGKKVHLVEMRDELAPDANVRHRPLLLKEIDKYVTVHTGYKGLEVTKDGILCEDKKGRKQLIPGTSVICALGQRPRTDVVEDLRDTAPYVAVIGDAAKVSTITNAVYWGYHAALDI